MIFNIQNLYNSLSEENKQKLKRTVGGAGSQVVREGIELSRLITKPEAEEVEETEKYLEALYSAYLGAENVERERRGDKEVTVIKEPESMGLQLTRDVLGFAGSMIGVGKLAKPLKGIEAIKKAEKAAPITSKVTQTVLTGEVAAQLSINPYEETLAGVVGSMLKDDDGLEGDIKKYLLDPLTSSQEKSELENRLALLGEGLVFTGAFAAAGKGLSLAKEPFLNTLNKIKSKGEDAVGDFLSRMSDYKQLDAKQKQVALQKRKKDIQDGKVADMGDIEALEAPKSTKWLSEVDLQFSQNDLLRNFSNFTNRLFNPRGGRTANMHEKFLKTENVKEKWNATISHIASNLDRTINEVITKTGANKEDLLNKINEVAFGSFGGIKNPEARQKIFDNALKNLPKEIQPLVVRMRETQDELSRMMTENDFLTKAQKEIYEDNLGSYVRNSYKLYSSPGYKPTKSVEKEAKAYLANQLRKDNPGMSENEVILQTDAQYKEIIGTRKDVSTFSSSLEKFDKVRKEIFQGRKEIPAPIKNLLGEIENPIDKFIFSASKLANAVEDLKFYDDIAQDGKNIYFYGDKTGVFSEQIPQGYGKLSGQYTTPQLKRYFSTVRKFGIDNEGEFGKIYRNLVLLKGISQSAKTVWSHATHIKNIAGGAQMSLANGTNVFNPKRLKETLKVLNAKTKPGELQEFYEELAGRGILNKGVVAGDLRGLVKDIEKMSPNNPMLAVLRNGVAEKAQKLYIAEDDFFKINMYLGEEQYLKRLNNALPDNLKMSDEAIKDEAAKMVRDVLPNYDLVPELLKDLRRTPVFGRFFSFMAESVRISVNSLSRGIKEVRRGQELLEQGNTKAGGIQMERGMRRLAAFTTVAGGGALALEKGSQALSGLSNEDIEAAKQFLPDYMQNSRIFVSVTPEGEPAIGNISSWDAFDFPKKPFQVIINRALSDKDYTEENIVTDILTTTASEMVSPFLGESIIQEQLSNYILRGGRTLDGRLMSNPYNRLQKFEEKDNYIESLLDPKNIDILMTNIVQGIEPGSVSSIRKYADTWDKEKTDFDQDIYPAQSFAKFITGFGVQPLNKEYMENVYSFKVKDLAKKKSSRRNSLYGAIGDELDPETFINNYLDVNEKYYREFAKLHKLTEAAEQFDLPVFELLKGTGFNKLDMTTFLGKKRNFMPLGLTEDLKLKMLESSASMDAWFDVVQDIAEIDRQLSNLPVLIDKDINKVMEQEEEPEASELFKTLQEDTYDRLQKVKGGLVEGPDVPFTDEDPADRVDPMTGQPYSAQTERVGFSIGGKVALQLSKVLTKEPPVPQAPIIQRFGRTYDPEKLAEQMERLATTRETEGSTKFVSPSLKTMIERGPQNIKGPQILDWLKASTNKGIRPDEIKELGIESYVKENPQATLGEVIKAVSPRQTKLTKAVKSSPNEDGLQFETKTSEYDPIDNTPLWSPLKEDLIADLKAQDGSVEDEILRFGKNNYKDIVGDIRNLDDLPKNKKDDLIDKFARHVYNDDPYEIITPTDTALREASEDLGGESFAFGNEGVGYTFFVAGVRRKTDEVYSANEAKITLERLLREEFPREAGGMEAYRYKQYIDDNLPGGDNYREVVFELADAKTPSYVSSHFDEENYLAHALVRDRKLADNTKTLHIDELQSDLHGKAKASDYATPENLKNIIERLPELESQVKIKRKEIEKYMKNDEGYFKPRPSWVVDEVKDFMKQFKGSELRYEVGRVVRKDLEENKEFFNLLDEYIKVDNEYADLIVKQNNLLPDYPYKENWHTVVINRILAEAIDEGYDAISLSPAKVLSDRYTDSYEEFYTNLYDKKVPSYLKKLAKRYKGKFERGKLDIDNTFGMGTEKFLAAPETGLDRRRKLSEVNILRITPEMREMIEKEGLQAFNKGGLVSKQMERLGFQEGGEVDLVELIKANLREKEDLRLEAYKPIPKEKYYTIGYGRYGSNIKKGDKITLEEAEQYLDEDVNVRLREISRLIPDYNSYPLEVQVPLFSEFYRGSVRQSPKTIELLNQKKYKEAAMQFLDNEEYRKAKELGKPGIRPRMEELSNALLLLGEL